VQDAPEVVERVTADRVAPVDDSCDAPVRAKTRRGLKSPWSRWPLSAPATRPRRSLTAAAAWSSSPASTRPFSAIRPRSPVRSAMAPAQDRCSPCRPPGLAVRRPWPSRITPCTCRSACPAWVNSGEEQSEGSLATSRRRTQATPARSPDGSAASMNGTGTPSGPRTSRTATSRRRSGPSASFRNATGPSRRTRKTWLPAKAGTSAASATGESVSLAARPQASAGDSFLVTGAPQENVTGSSARSLSRCSSRMRAVPLRAPVGDRRRRTR
jgi:hypothetical protein